MPATTSATPSQLPLQGDEAALFRTYHEALERAVAGRVITSAANIEDACSFAWSQLLRYQPRRDTAFAWLRIVAIREAIRLDRRSRAIASLDEPVPSATDWSTADHGTPLVERLPAPDATQRAEAIQALERIAALPQRRRRVFAAHVAGLSYDEIAAREGLSYTAVNKQMTKARNAIRRTPLN